MIRALHRSGTQTVLRMVVRVVLPVVVSVAIGPVLAVAQGTPSAKPRVTTPAPATTTAPSPKDSAGVVIMREVYSYPTEGRRDPFVSLMTTGELRPLLTDLVLLGVIYDTESPRRSIAILTDGSTGQTYRVTVGTTIGRMKIAKIGQEDVTFAVDEFGMSRQQTLVMDKSPKKDAKGNTTRRPQ